MSAVLAQYGIVGFGDFPVSYNTASTSAATWSAQVISLYGKQRALQSKAAKDPDLFTVHDRLDTISALPEHWDGYGSAAPNVVAIARARQFIEVAYDKIVSSSLGGWKYPHVSPSESGEIAFEWWNGIRKLTVYAHPNGTSYLKSWGPDMVNEMEEGELQETDILKLWAWLYQ
jgi:hypothetical protein